MFCTWWRVCGLILDIHCIPSIMLHILHSTITPRIMHHSSGEMHGKRNLWNAGQENPQTSLKRYISFFVEQPTEVCSPFRLHDLFSGSTCPIYYSKTELSPWWLNFLPRDQYHLWWKNVPSGVVPPKDFLTSPFDWVLPNMTDFPPKWLNAPPWIKLTLKGWATRKIWLRQIERFH